MLSLQPVILVQSYYNLRKRFGFELARLIMDFWTYYHVEEPSSSDEALFFYIFAGDI